MTQTSTTTADGTLQELNGETYIYLGPAILVASRSVRGDFHTVLNGECSCLGYSHRGVCRHVALARVVQEVDRETAEPVEPDMIWAGWHTGWVAR